MERVLMSLFTRTRFWHDATHELYADSARRFLAAELVPNITRYVEQGEVDRSFWRKAGEAGLMAGSVPDADGGAGGGPGFAAITIYEQAATSDTSWGFAIQVIVIHYLIAFGSDAQKAEWLPGLINGETIGALAMTEPGCGSDVQAIRTHARRAGKVYRINGSKMFITNGRMADLVLLATKTDTVEGSKGISLILVDGNTAQGLERGQHLNKLGMRGSDTAELVFMDVEVPLDNLLGP
ncbi:MAG: acyl-CoA dehydrogenase family protein, partial [Rhodobacteraceae bacterium]|nr:acyl-CoA dehydrogenase family protein [Paracoccaceae bacterium]